MKTTALALAATLAGGTVVSAQTAELGPLVDPAALSGALGDVTVLDIRAPEGFSEGHIEGAVNAPYSTFRGPEENPGQLPEVEALQQTYRDLGLTAEDHVVIAYQGESVTDFGAAARVYWTLKSSGLPNLSILNGGVLAWTESGQKLTSDGTEVSPSEIEVSWDDTWTATVQDVQSVLNGNTEALLLDARPESFWQGEQAHPAAARPGTIPQSQYFEHAGWFSDGPAIVDADAAQSLADEQGFTGNERIISFCNTGHWAATNWFALSELAGIDNVKLYPESMVGWSNAGYEMANVPSRLQQLWRSITSVF